MKDLVNRNIIYRIAKGISRRVIHWAEFRELQDADNTLGWQGDCIESVNAVNRFIFAEHLCDIGAHLGYWTQVMHVLNPALKSVVMFEPMERMHQKLEKLVLGGVEKRIYKCALDDQGQVRELLGGTASASLLKASGIQTRYFPESIKQECESVEVRVLDEVYETDSLGYPDVIKIDVQGAELNVLRGGERVLSNARYLVAELSLQEFYFGQPALWELLRFLHEHDYIMVDRGHELRSRASPYELLQFDGVFANTKYL